MIIIAGVHRIQGLACISSNSLKTLRQIDKKTEQANTDREINKK